MCGKASAVAAAWVLAAVLSCSSGDGDGAASARDASVDAGARRDAGARSDAGQTAPDAGAPAAGTVEPIPPECQAYPLEGLLHSPGGEELPDKCNPFHPTTNNPYAIRCIDAWPHFRTRFPGDELCILPPPPDKGIQIGLHPQARDWYAQVSTGDMSGYDDPGPDWVLPPGDEQTINYRSGAGNPEQHNYYRTYFRMRYGSHHNIITLHVAGAAEEVWLPGQDLPGLFDSESGPVIGVLGGQQRPDDNTPVTLEKPAEDAGLYLRWPVSPSIVLNMHHFNVWETDVLKEGWANIWWEDDAETLISWFMGLDFSQVLSLSVPPGETVDLHYVWPVNYSTRLLRTFGHRHAWTSNFSSWIERASGETELVYQSFDWFDMPTYRYDSQVENPPLNPEGRTDGAASGVIMMDPGDELHFNCHVAYTNERAAKEDAPMPSEIGRLRFANEAFAGEMCIQFGNVTGSALGTPVVAPEPPPDFATVD